MIKLIDYKEKYIGRGKIIRMRSEYPYEDTVDLMVFEVRDSGTDCNLGLIVTTGKKAGLIYTYLPNESSEYTAVLSQWLKDNWCDKIYPWCPINDVYICDNYQPPKIEIPK